MPKRQFALIIPAYKERFDFVARLEQHPQADQTVLFLVLNEPQSHAYCSENTDFYKQLCAQAKCIETHAELELWQFNRLSIVLIRQQGQHALPDKQGVGLARKLGADTAAHAMQRGLITQPWLFSSDADAQLPDNYFDFVLSDENSAINSAWVFNFHHELPSNAAASATSVEKIDAIVEATRLYERCIKYYSAQLLAAGSPYGYPSLGSCLSVSLLHYCQVRGFPKRAAAEDFYLLNKLAKLAPVRYAEHIKIRIEARISDRVPFGTGPAVAKLVSALENNETIKYYDPAIFQALAELLNATKSVWESPQDPLSNLPIATQNALIDAGFLAFLKKRRQQDKHYPQFERSFHQWFDAFQTLKFIKRLQNSHFPELDVSAIENL